MKIDEKTPATGKIAKSTNKYSLFLSVFRLKSMKIDEKPLERQKIGNQVIFHPIFDGQACILVQVRALFSLERHLIGKVPKVGRFREIWCFDPPRTPSDPP